MKTEYLVHLCAGDRGECKDVWIAADDSQDPEAIALDTFLDFEGARLLFKADGSPVIRGESYLAQEPHEGEE